MNIKFTPLEKTTLIVIVILMVIGLFAFTVSVVTTSSKNVPTVTFDSQWMESFIEENGEDVIYWEIDWIGLQPCRKYKYTTCQKTKIHIYYECEDYSSGFEVIMNPETGRCTIWESGH